MNLIILDSFKNFFLHSMRDYVEHSELQDLQFIVPRDLIL